MKELTLEHIEFIEWFAEHCTYADSYGVKLYWTGKMNPESVQEIYKKWKDEKSKVTPEVKS